MLNWRVFQKLKEGQYGWNGGIKVGRLWKTAARVLESFLRQDEDFGLYPQWKPRRWEEREDCVMLMTFFWSVYPWSSSYVVDRARLCVMHDLSTVDSLHICHIWPLMSIA